MRDIDYLLESLTIFRRIDFLILDTMLVKELLDFNAILSARRSVHRDHVYDRSRCGGSIMNW
jgi:hypothetical protein